MLIDRRAAGETVRRLQGYAAHPAFTDLLSHLGGDDDLLVVDHELHLDGGVDLGQSVRREFDVEDRTGDGDDPAILEAGWPR